MSKKSYKLQIICDHILTKLDEIQIEKHRGRASQKKLPVFPTKKSLIDFVLSDPAFHDTESQEKIIAGQIEICRTTVNNAINLLLEDARIIKSNEGYEIVPHYHKRFDNFPILSIAKRIKISIGVPENILFLSVESGAANSVANFLSEIFHLGDIIFIPLDKVIMCVEVLPREIITGQKEYKKHKPEHFRERIESAIRLFDYEYPDFHYGTIYETGTTVHLDPYFKHQVKLWAQTIYNTSIDSQIIGETQEDIFRRTLEGMGQFETLTEREQKKISDKKARRQKRLELLFNHIYEDPDSYHPTPTTPCTKKILAYLEKGKPLTREDIKGKMILEGYTTRTICRALRHLRDTGAITPGFQVSLLRKQPNSNQEESSTEPSNSKK